LLDFFFAAAFFAGAFFAADFLAGTFAPSLRANAASHESIAP
jgi:hypothetical protein